MEGMEAADSGRLSSLRVEVAAEVAAPRVIRREDLAPFDGAVGRELGSRRPETIDIALAEHPVTDGTVCWHSSFAPPFVL